MSSTMGGGPNFNRASLESRITDFQRRIRNLEAVVGGGGCPDCVLDPFSVNPGDIFVPPEFIACVDVNGGCAQWDVICGTGNVFLLDPTTPAGWCSAYGLSKPLQFQFRLSTSLQANTANVIVYAGPLSGQVYSQTWDVAGSPDDSPAFFDSGWFGVETPLCAPACDQVFTGASFQSHNGGGGCAGPGTLCWRWVVTAEDGTYRGALDDLPIVNATDQDVVHFSSATHEFVVGAPERRTAYFLG